MAACRNQNRRAAHVLRKAIRQTAKGKIGACTAEMLTHSNQFTGLCHFGVSAVRRLLKLGDFIKSQIFNIDAKSVKPNVC
mmetsp:Transcript_55161/g.63410  ORF Transcript_55161/g.63410 Transcript_55161/m.63410 type:complete len:80 (-) Transcript_55161:26-265(-)